MRTARLSARDILAIVRRRWKYPVIITTVAVVGSVIGALTATRKYESSTTILVKPDQTLNPLGVVPGYESILASDEQLRNFNEIILSRTSLDAMGDSLKLSTPDMGEWQLQAVAKIIAGSITTWRLGSDSFRIIYSDTDPVRAKRGAEVAAHLFIQKKTEVQIKQDELRVQFYQEKVDQYRLEFESTVQTVVSSLKQKVQDMPLDARALYIQIEEIGREITKTDSRIRDLQVNLAILVALPERMRSSPNDFRRENGKQPLFELERADLPYVSELRVLILQYDDLTRRYRPGYPEIDRVEEQIIDLLLRMERASKSEISRQRDLLSVFEQRREAIIEELKKSSVIQQESDEKASTFVLKRRTYEELKTKLEQARLALEVGQRGANQFIVLDPPRVPVVASKPDRKLIVLAGLALGLALGVLVGILVELFDTTVRTPVDLEVYSKPIIAFLPERATPAAPVRGWRFGRRRRE
jgi:polysaccharide biosynthesis transport protein